MLLSTAFKLYISPVDIFHETQTHDPLLELVLLFESQDDGDQSMNFSK